MFIFNDPIAHTSCIEIVMACNHANVPAQKCLPSMVVNSNEAIVTICLSIKHIPDSGVDIHQHQELLFTKTSSADEAVCDDDDGTPEQFNWYCRRSDVHSDN